MFGLHPCHLMLILRSCIFFTPNYKTMSTLHFSFSVSRMRSIQWLHKMCWSLCAWFRRNKFLMDLPFLWHCLLELLQLLLPFILRSMWSRLWTRFFRILSNLLSSAPSLCFVHWSHNLLSMWTQFLHFLHQQHLHHMFRSRRFMLRLCSFRKSTCLYSMFARILSQPCDTNLLPLLSVYWWLFSMSIQLSNSKTIMHRMHSKVSGWHNFYLSKMQIRQLRYQNMFKCHWLLKFSCHQRNRNLSFMWCCILLLVRQSSKKVCVSNRISTVKVFPTLSVSLWRWSHNQHGMRRWQQNQWWRVFRSVHSGR